MRLDQQQVEKALCGDREAFQCIVEQTWQILFLFVQQKISNRETARDITQDTYLQAWEKLTTVREGASFFSWLLTIASNKVIDYMRRRAVRPESSLAAEVEIPGRPEGRTGPEAGEQADRVRAALGCLDDLYRTVLILRYWSGMSPGQIARLLAEPEGTIRNRIFRAHIRLRALLDKSEQAEECGQPPQEERQQKQVHKRRQPKTAKFETRIKGQNSD